MARKTFTHDEMAQQMIDAGWAEGVDHEYAHTIFKEGFAFAADQALDYAKDQLNRFAELCEMVCLGQLTATSDEANKRAMRLIEGDAKPQA